MGRTFDLVGVSEDWVPRPFDSAQGRLFARKDGAPSMVVMPKRSKAWATCPAPQKWASPQGRVLQVSVMHLPTSV